ncbi:hypothetical protein HYY71_05755 [Candidatus Woesearchaeota archaeon]|nr:hypothetical protein [Candidatus Woesearchaeota archaeon]
MEFINKNTIKLDKEINELDKLVFKFIKILEKHSDYVIISGYVAILLGRSRSTEDIDVFIKETDFEAFSRFYDELKRDGFWCLNAEEVHEIYTYLSQGLAARFALKNHTIPNFEVKFAKKHLDKASFEDRITVVTQLGNIFISSLERQIAFKKYYLKSDKDIEDAKHIESLFKDNIDIEKINKYKKLLVKGNEIPKAGKGQ